MTASTRTLPSRYRLAGLLAIGVIVLAACGSPDPSAEVTAGQGPTVEGAVSDTSTPDTGAPTVPAPAPDRDGVAVDDPLPTLPPIDDRHPELFTDAGCAETSLGPDCEIDAAGIDETQAGDSERDWRVLAGFVGTRWSTDPTGAVTVLGDTVTSPAAGIWWARGLVRNDTADPVADLRVRATLVGADGAELGVVEADIALPVVRPGEPVPFELVTDEVTVAEVHEVRWSTTHTTATTAPVRDLEWSTYWQRPDDGAEPVDNYLYTDPADGSRPLVVFGSATVRGAVPVGGVTVTAAWMDPAGRIVALADGIVGPTPEGGLPVGGAADVLLAVDGVQDAQLLLWAWAS